MLPLIKPSFTAATLGLYSTRTAVMSLRAFSSTEMRGAMSRNQQIEALGHPVPPAGAKTSYALFVRDFFAKNKPVVEKLPNGRPNLSNLASQMSSEWTSMSASDKQPYINQANESKAQYEREFEAFYDSLEPGQLREIEHILGKKIRMPGGRAKQAANKREAMGAPKKPLTAFFLFMKALRAKGTLATNDANEKLSVLEQSKAASQQWKTMDEQKRKPYQDESDRQKAAYQKWKDANGN